MHLLQPAMIEGKVIDPCSCCFRSKSRVLTQAVAAAESDYGDSAFLISCGSHALYQMVGFMNALSRFRASCASCFVRILVLLLVVVLLSLILIRLEVVCVLNPIGGVVSFPLFFRVFSWLECFESWDMIS